jgi:hypothetical protein
MAEVIIKSSVHENDTISVGLDKKTEEIKIRVVKADKGEPSDSDTIEGKPESKEN